MNRKTHPDSGHSETRRSDAKFWRKAILQRHYGEEDQPFDKYRWASRFVQLVKSRHDGDAQFRHLMEEFDTAWAEHGGPGDISREDARQAIEDCWQHADTLLAESIASRGGFKRPPTFSDHGSVVPRNIDEANS